MQRPDPQRIPDQSQGVEVPQNHDHRCPGVSQGVMLLELPSDATEALLRISIHTRIQIEIAGNHHKRNLDTRATTDVTLIQLRILLAPVGAGTTGILSEWFSYAPWWHPTVPSMGQMQSCQQKGMYRSEALFLTSVGPFVATTFS